MSRFILKTSASVIGVKPVSFALRIRSTIFSFWRGLTAAALDSLRNVAARLASGEAESRHQFQTISGRLKRG